MVQATDGASDAGRGKGKRARSVITVTVLRENQQVAMVQWSVEGRVRRALVPLSAVTDGKCPEEVLEAGVLLSADWVSMWNQVSATLSSPAVEAELQRNGMWSMEDAIANPARYYGALQRLAGLAGAAMIKNSRGG